MNTDMKTFLFRVISFFLLSLLLLSFIGCQSNKQQEKDDLPDEPVFPNESEAPSDEESKSDKNDDKMSEVNGLRPDYDFGTCKKLVGNVSVVLFYMDDFESKWTNAEIAKFTQNEVEPGLAFLESEAEKYGVKTNLIIQKVYKSLQYNDEVIININETGMATADVLEMAAREAGFSNAKIMLRKLRAEYQTDEVICLTVFNKKGTAYAINPKRDAGIYLEEHCILFARDQYVTETDAVGLQSSVCAHEILHLFGAEDFYVSASRKNLAKKHYEKDIMLSANYSIQTNDIGKATAFYIGWIHEVPSVLYDKEW